VGVWTRGTLRALSAAAPGWSIELALFRGEELDLDPLGMGPSVSVTRLGHGRRIHTRLSAIRLLPALERYAGEADVMLGPAFATWPARNAAEIPVIHDLSFLKYPETVSRRNLIYLRMGMRRIVRRAALVITVSEAMRNEIVDDLGVEADRVAVVPNGVDASLFASSEGRTDDLPGRYLLFVGTIEPRKNLRNVLSAYSLLRDRLADPPELVIAGGRGWRDARLPPAEDMSGVRFLGYVDQPDLVGLYAHAEGLVFPSLYEGFGLPVVEAMAAGTPVVTSRRGALPEVAGDAALYVDPEDPSDIADGLQKLLEDRKLQGDLAEKGRVRARTFTWERSGVALRDAIEQAVNRKRR
jgi:alpha-1,3-rhamnosyl/mannosyltransferase